METFTLQWHLTHRCNLRCSHCYQEDYASFTDFRDVKSVLDDFSRLCEKTGTQGHINLTGGEPMTYSRLYPLLEEIRARGMTFALLTNGTLVGKADARRLKALDPLYVQVSLDGMKKVHDRIRGDGAFDAAVEGLCCLLREGIDATVAFTAQTQNLGELPKLARFLKPLGVKKLWYDRVVVPAAEDENGLSLSPGQVRRLLKTGARLSKGCPVTNQRALQFLYASPKQVYTCQAGRRLLVLLADGTILPCRRLPIELGNVRETSLTEVWEQNETMKALRAAPVPEGCAGCRWRESCAGGAKCIAYAKTGRWDQKDPDCPI